MIKRDIEKAYGADYVPIYEQVAKEAEKSFKEAGQRLTVFHTILVDKVADAYVASLQVSDQVADRKIKQQATELQKWLKMSLDEVRGVESLARAKRVFYEKVIGVLDDTVADDSLRREILKKIRDVVEE